MMQVFENSMLNTKAWTNFYYYSGQKNICEFQVSQPYLHVGYCPNTKHIIVQNEQSIVKYGEKCGKIWLRTQIYT